MILGWPLDTLSLGLSQFYGHGSWLMCEVALRHPQSCLGKVARHPPPAFGGADLGVDLQKKNYS